MTTFQHQYELVKSSRKVLLEYCRTISDTNFAVENSTFGRGSIRNLLVHIGNTYEYWIGKALRAEMQFTEYNSIKNVTEAESFFNNIDSLVENFLAVYYERSESNIQMNVQDKVINATPLKLFTHVITHEFHHKGQILSLSRHLGYIPVDTDIIR